MGGNLQLDARKLEGRLAQNELWEKAVAEAFVHHAHNCEVVIHNETRARHNLMPIEYGVVFTVAWVSDFDVRLACKRLARKKVFLSEGMVRSQRDINRVLDQGYDEKLFPRRQNDESAVEFPAQHAFFDCSLVFEAREFEFDFRMGVCEFIYDARQPANGGRCECSDAHRAAFQMPHFAQTRLKRSLARAHVLNPR